MKVNFKRLLFSIHRKCKLLFVHLQIRLLSIEKNDEFVVIIFSKDRPLQLNGLLESLYFFVKGNFKVVALYQTSNDRQLHCYNNVQANFPDVFFVKEQDFRIDLVKILNDSRPAKVFFLVDDILFTDYIDLDELRKFDCQKYIISLRLHPKVTFSYMMQQEQEVPSLEAIDKDLILFDFNNAGIDWAYPLSVDGHIFCRKEILLFLKHVKFKAPNSLESALQVFNNLVKKNKKGICYSSAKMINFAINKVQTEFKNISGSIATDTLLEFFENGYKIDFKKYHKKEFHSVHIDQELLLTK